MQRFLLYLLVLAVGAAIVYLWQGADEEKGTDTPTASNPDSNGTLSPQTTGNQSAPARPKLGQPERDATDSAATKDDQVVGTGNSITTMPKRMWQPKQFEPATVGDTPSQWINAATNLGTVHLTQSFFALLQVGKVLRLPVDPPLDFKITESSEVVGTPGTSWMTTMVNHRGKLLNHHGVITATPEVLFITLHTANGIYYLHSTDKSAAELAYVSYAQLREQQQ